MKSVKFILTSIICLLLSMFFLFAFTTEDNPTIGIIGFYGFMLAFLVFFILGWVVKDKPIVPKNSSTETNDKNKSE